MLCLSILQAGAIATNITPALKNNTFMHIKFLDQLELNFDTMYGVNFAELSDLAYNPKTKILHMVSDKGALFSFHTKISKKIEELTPLRATKLKNTRGKRFKKWKRDSEGLTLDGKGRLLISFEGKAKIGYFHKNSSLYGQMIRKYKLPSLLKNTKNYRFKNKSLESVAWHSVHGVLTASEWPLKRDNNKRQTIYALDGKTWHFTAEPDTGSAVVAMEVMDDGNILILERAYSGLLQPFVITLKKVYLNNLKAGLCSTKILAKMNSHEGWQLDNFEGLTKVGKNRYMMISDDGDNFFQRTLLIYFEVID